MSDEFTSRRAIREQGVSQEPFMIGRIRQ